MAGYKKSILNLKPNCLLSFDGDSFFDTQGYLRGTYFHDESNNENHGLMDTTEAQVKSYSAAVPSLTPRESSRDRYSVCFAPRGYDENMPFPYDRSVIEILHKNDLNMKDEFTIMFLFKKENNESFLQGKVYNPETNKYVSPTSTNYRTFERTLFVKGVSLGVKWIYTMGSTSPQTLRFIFPDMNINLNGVNFPRDFYNRTFHITMTRKKVQVGSSLFKTINTVYVDGRIVGRHESNITSNPSTAFSTSSIFIGGNKDLWDYNTLNDRQTSPLYIDNFTVWNERCLDENQVANLYKKCFDFTEYTKRMFPSIYAQFDDTNINPNNSTNTGRLDIGSQSFTYYGTSSQIEGNVSGPMRLMNNRSVKFNSGGMAKIYNQYSSPVFNPINNYTIEFFAKIGSGNKGVVFSMQTDYYPYKGVLVECNVDGDEYRKGAIQVKIEENVTIVTDKLDSQGNNLEYDDNQFHHYVIIRRENIFEFWIDGNLIDSKYGNVGSVVQSFGTIYIMGMMPDNRYVDGNFCQLACYDYAMEVHNIKARAFFFTRMLIRGKITLHGKPHSATLRIMNHKDASLLTQGDSNSDTGDYVIDIYSDDFVDVLVLDLKDPNIRYRAFGPLLPEEITDIDENYW